ncbi:hypothetical protein, partial [Salmonella enterica]|uniref:hypothetical protein n=1 Tax=Salmonella enterica TaxID=28901 RepID=UPI00344BCE2B
AKGISATQSFGRDLKKCLELKRVYLRPLKRAGVAGRALRAVLGCCFFYFYESGSGTNEHYPWGNNIPILNNELYFYFLWLLDGVR